MLRVESLTKVFDDVKAVDNLSFHLDQGKICGFVGPNGAGKTTTMRIIATLEEPTSGEVFVDNVSIYDDPYAIRRNVGFMPDHYGAYPSLNCNDYLQFYARAYEIPTSDREKRIRQIMDFTGLDRIADKKVETLSKGQKQRLNLSRALINDSKILIMDEPAAGLDPRARIELRYLMKALVERGKTIFVSSHILTELSEVCDHMLVISHGRMVKFGSFEEIQRSMMKTIEVVARVLDTTCVDKLERFLAERIPHKDIRVGENGLVKFPFGEDKSLLPSLLKEIMNADIPLIEFKMEALSMEDIFIQITEGD